MAHHSAENRPALPLLLIGAIGVVFGDIGTSPLYAMKECFGSHHGIAPDRESVYGIVSLIIWSMFMIISLLYMVFILRADKDGEGGILSMLSLALQKLPEGEKAKVWLPLLGVFGAALLYGDGMITPAISTLGAIEGLTLINPSFKGLILPLSVVILIGLFSMQRMGTEKVGRFFGPIMVVWFLSIASLGLNQVMKTPGILHAFNPWYGIKFLFTHGWHGFLVLGSVFLVVTGGESLYADIGHFGKKPIRLGWATVVLPCLILNYLGQGGLILENPSLVKLDNFHPFFQLAPSFILIPLVCLATMAAVIASQALISGCYSLTLGAIQLGYLPRVGIRHTSFHTRGQIYVPFINWVLCIFCIGLVIKFESSSALAAAYGIAVSLTMCITATMLFYVMRYSWNWSQKKALLVLSPLLLIEVVFCIANATKIIDGGYFPLVIAAALFTLMTTWRSGRRLVAQDQEAESLKQEEFIESIKHSPNLVRVPGTAVFMSGTRNRTPTALLHNLKHNKVLHERVIFLTVVTDDTPFVSREKQAELEPIGDGFFRLTGHYGFMQEPDVPQLLRRAKSTCGFECHDHDVTFFLGRETIVPSKKLGMALWRERLFAFVSRLAQSPAHYFRLPENRVVELGVRVRI